MALRHDKPRGGACALGALAWFACSSPTGDPTHPTTTGAPTVVASPPAAPAGRLPAGVEPLKYVLELDIDPTAKTFRGVAKIMVKLAEGAPSVFLHGKDLTVKSVRIRARDGSMRPATATALEEATLLRIDVPGGLSAGEHGLEIDYEVTYSDDLAGVYRVRSDDRWYVFSQFEALDARRAFPCFDEPSFKTPFEITLTVPAGDKAFSNAPVAEETTDGKTRRVRFAPTQKLPTYLVALGVGPFDIVEAAPIPAQLGRSSPTPLRGIAVKGKGPLLKEALAQHARLVSALEVYFGIPYPFDKLDIIAVPDLAAGAMENAGAITYKEAFILVDPATSGPGQIRDVVEFAAHELAHQWFGNLVTMQWWDDLWLNEAFATWMGEGIGNSLYPTFRLDLSLMREVQGAMDSDSLLSARKIRQPIVTAGDVENGFDDLTYSKGAGIIDMFEHFVGPEPFRAGVQRYLERHRFGSATTDDFLKDVFEGQPAALASAFRQFLERPGVPKLRVEAKCEGTQLASLTASIERWLPLGSKADPKGDWVLPLCVRLPSGPVCDLVDARAGRATPLKGASGACPSYTFANAAGAAYARFSPTAEQAKELFGKSFSKLDARERLAAVDSLAAAFRSGTLDAGALLEAIETIARDDVREVAFAPIEVLTFIEDHVVTDADRDRFSKYAARVFGPTARRVGWEAVEKHESTDRQLDRHDAYHGLLLVARDASARKNATHRARRALGLDKAPSSKDAGLSAELIEAVLVVGVQDGGADVFDAIVKTLRTENDAALRPAYLAAIAAATDPTLAAKARALYLDPAVRASERLRYLHALLKTRAVRRDTWAWFRGDLKRITDALPGVARGYMPTFVEDLCDASLEKEVRAAFAPHLSELVGAERTLENAIEKMLICDAIRTRQQPGLSAWLKKP